MAVPGTLTWHRQDYTIQQPRPVTTAAAIQTTVVFQSLQ